MTVNIKPMPTAYRQISKKFRPAHPPIFDSAPTAADIELARALFAVLDRESQRWYGTCDGLFADLAHED